MQRETSPKPTQARYDANSTITRAEHSNLYERLGVSATASSDEIRSAFHKSALAAHPDFNSSPEAKAAFIRLSEAYSTLSDRTLRADYDRQIGSQTTQSNQELGALTLPKLESPPVATKQIDHACPGELLNPKVTSRLVDGETLGEIFLAAFRGDRPNFGQLKDEYGSILGETADRVKLKELLGGSPAQVAPMFEGSISLDLPDELKKSRSQIRLHIVSQDGKVLDTADIARGRAHFGILLENIPKDAALLIETANKVNLNTPISELTAAYDNQHTAA